LAADLSLGWSLSWWPSFVPLVTLLFFWLPCRSDCRLRSCLYKNYYVFASNFFSSDIILYRYLSSGSFMTFLGDCTASMYSYMTREKQVQCFLYKR
jgi:hypothetical protein